MSKKSQSTSSNRALIQFVEPGTGAPASLLAGVEIPITEGPLAGLKVSGIRIWPRKTEPDHLFVTFPGRQYETGEGETRTYEYLRPTDGQGETAKEIRGQILAAYRAHRMEVSPAR